MIDIVFDGAPGPEGGRFVEVESPPGTSINFGKRVHRDDGYWVLRIAACPTEDSAKGSDATPTRDELMRVLTEYEGALQEDQEEDIAPARQALLDFLRPIREHLDASPSAMPVNSADAVAESICDELTPRTPSEKAAYLEGVAEGKMQAKRDGLVTGARPVNDEVLTDIWNAVNDAAARPTLDRMPVHLVFARALFGAKP